MVHAAGGLVYLDGANMNAILGITRPGDFGADMMHFNPHKTFSGPHGGGGPGAGPIAVAEKLAPYLPVAASVVQRRATATDLDYDRPKSIGRVRSFFGNVGVLVRMYCYIRTHGPDGLRKISENAVLNANYLLEPREAHPAGAAGRPLHARVRGLGRADQGRARHLGHGYRQAAVGLRLPRPHGLLPADRQGGDDDRADRDREQGHARRLRRNAGVHHPRDAASNCTTPPAPRPSAGPTRSRPRGSQD